MDGNHRNPWDILLADTRAVLPTLLKADTELEGLWVMNPSVESADPLVLLSGEWAIQNDPKHR